MLADGVDGGAEGVLTVNKLFLLGLVKLMRSLAKKKKKLIHSQRESILGIDKDCASLTGKQLRQGASHWTHVRSLPVSTSR